MIHEYFKRREFACHCGCGFDAVDAELLNVLIDIRIKFGVVLITSGCRCKAHNYKIGGADTSQHCLAKAADIVVPAVPQIQVYQYLNDKYPDKYGIGSYSRWTHIDVRRERARW